VLGVFTMAPCRVGPPSPWAAVPPQGSGDMYQEFFKTRVRALRAMADAVSVLGTVPTRDQFAKVGLLVV
jgi:hypothetical protein